MSEQPATRADVDAVGAHILGEIRRELDQRFGGVDDELAAGSRRFGDHEGRIRALEDAEIARRTAERAAEAERKRRSRNLFALATTAWGSLAGLGAWLLERVIETGRPHS